MKRVLKTVAVAFIIALILILIKNEYARCLPASTYGHAGSHPERTCG